MQLPIRRENVNFMLMIKTAIEVEVQYFHLCHRKNESFSVTGASQPLKIKGCTSTFAPIFP